MCPPKGSVDRIASGMAERSLADLSDFSNMGPKAACNSVFRAESVDDAELAQLFVVSK